jgi:hypothetical protein
VNTSTDRPPITISRRLAARHGRSVPALVLVVVAAAAIVVSAVVHLHLWGKADGYRNVPTIGPLFVVQGISGCILAVAMLALRRALVTFAGAVYMGMSLGGLLLSIHSELFDYQETLDAPFVKLSIVVEIIGLVAAVAASAVSVIGVPGNDRRAERLRPASDNLEPS